MTGHDRNPVFIYSFERQMQSLNVRSQFEGVVEFLILNSALESVRLVSNVRTGADKVESRKV